MANEQSLTRWRLLPRLLRAVIRGLLTLLAALDIRGRENFPPDGPYIVVTNHLHWLDIPAVFIAVPHEAATFAAEKWEHHWFNGPLLRYFGHAIFVQRGEPDRRALSQALSWLRQGGVLAIAPEGTRSRTGTLQQGKPGAAYLASRTGVPIVPVVAWGQERVWHDWRHLRRPRIHVRVGKPFVLPGTPNQAKGEQLDAYTEQVMLALARLLPEPYRGVYREKVAGESRGKVAHHPSLEASN